MKIIVALLLLTGLGCAKDPPKKTPHIYIAFAVYNQALSDKEGHICYALLCRDAKGDKILVGVSKETLEQINQIAKPTSISYVLHKDRITKGGWR